MARAHQPIRSRVLVALAAAAAAAGASVVIPSGVGASVETTPTSASWCTAQGSSVGAWVATNPPLPVCGPGPAYGGTWQYVDIPGPFGSFGSYFNATPGFQCVELAERYLSVVDGLAPVKANGAQVAINYHAAYPETSLVVNGSPGAVGHAPAPGDVISVAEDAGFDGDGHVAVVVRSSVNASGNGTVTVAQQNVAAPDYIYTLGLENWRLFDPHPSGDVLLQFSYAEWLVVPPLRPATPGVEAKFTVGASPAQIALDETVTAAVEAALLPRLAHRAPVHRSGSKTRG